jgi:FkbM family methyltransferase
MSLRKSLVSWMDEHSPALIGLGRYHFHVSLRGDVVYPKITRTIFERIGSRELSAIDVGANVGIFSRYLAAHFRHVVAVEPIPYLAERLERAKIRSCSVIQAALGEQAGSVTMRIPVDAGGREMSALSTASSSNALAFIDSASVVERVVPCRRLDDVEASAGKIAFVKIDVEGFEYSVLRGARRLLNESRPTIQLEIGRAHNPEYKAVLSLMADAGFTGFAMQKDGLQTDLLRFLEAQPITVSDKESASPDGCWDYLFVPVEKVGVLTAGLIRN